MRKERDRERFKSERRYLDPFSFHSFFPSFHRRSCWRRRRSFCHRSVSTRAVEEHGILRHRLFPQVQFNSIHTEREKGESKAYICLLLSNSKTSAISSRSKSYLTISHFKQTNLTGTAGKSGLAPYFPTTTITTTTSLHPQLINRMPSWLHTPGSNPLNP